jgi:glutamine synthetase
MTTIALTARHQMPPLRVSTPSAALDALAARDLSLVVVTMVDTAGVTRAIAVPVDALGETIKNGLRLRCPVAGANDELRLRPDWSALRILAAQPGWAWVSADLVTADNESFAGCQRGFLRRMIEQASACGLAVRVGCNLSFFLNGGEDGALRAPSLGPAYSFAGLAHLSTWVRDLLEAFVAAGVEVAKIQRGAGECEVELQLAARDPITAADNVVFARETIHTTSARHGWRCAFAPALPPGDAGDRGRFQLSLRRHQQKLLSSGDGQHVLTKTGEAFAAGVLAELPALSAFSAPTDNGDTAVRLVDDRNAEAVRPASIEAALLQTNHPYLAIGASIAAGLAGIKNELRLPLPLEHRPGTLDAALDSLQHSTVLHAAMGPTLLETFVASRRGRRTEEPEQPAATHSRTTKKSESLANRAGASIQINGNTETEIRDE